MAKTLTLTLQRDTSPALLYQVAGDEHVSDWNYWSRTLDPEFIATHGMRLAPAVYGYSPEPVPSPSDYHVDEEPLRSAYLQINNYDGDGQRRCENYLWKDDTAIYNGKGFPGRELITMSGNRLQGLEWVPVNGRRYLKFKTLRPTDDVAGMTFESHPHFVHKFILVKWDEATGRTAYTDITPRGRIYFYLVSRDGEAYMPERYVQPYRRTA